MVRNSPGETGASISENFHPEKNQLSPGSCSKRPEQSDGLFNAPSLWDSANLRKWTVDVRTPGEIHMDHLYLGG